MFVCNLELFLSLLAADLVSWPEPSYTSLKSTEEIDRFVASLIDASGPVRMTENIPHLLHVAPPKGCLGGIARYGIATVFCAPTSFISAPFHLRWTSKLIGNKNLATNFSSVGRRPTAGSDFVLTTLTVIFLPNKKTCLTSQTHTPSAQVSTDGVTVTAPNQILEAFSNAFFPGHTKSNSYHLELENSAVEQISLENVSAPSTPVIAGSKIRANFEGLKLIATPGCWLRRVLGSLALSLCWE